MDAAVGADRFWEMFKGRAVVVSQLPVGHSRALAAAASAMAAATSAAHLKADFTIKPFQTREAQKRGPSRASH